MNQPEPTNHPARDRQGEEQTEAEEVRLDEDGRDIETGCFPGCASQSFPDPGICYCDDEAAAGARQDGPQQ